MPERSQVLELGAAAGRFTIEMARMGCRVVLSDISPVQLEANTRRLDEAGFEDAQGLSKRPIVVLSAVPAGWCTPTQQEGTMTTMPDEITGERYVAREVSYYLAL